MICLKRPHRLQHRPPSFLLIIRTPFRDSMERHSHPRGSIWGRWRRLRDLQKMYFPVGMVSFAATDDPRPIPLTTLATALLDTDIMFVHSVNQSLQGSNFLVLSASFREAWRVFIRLVRSHTLSSFSKLPATLPTNNRCFCSALAQNPLPISSSRSSVTHSTYAHVALES